MVTVLKILERFHFDQVISDKDHAYKEHIGVVFDDLRVPDKLEIKDMDKVFADIFKTWNSDRFFEVIQRFELPTNVQIKTFSRNAYESSLSHGSSA